MPTRISLLALALALAIAAPGLARAQARITVTAIVDDREVQRLDAPVAVALGDDPRSAPLIQGASCPDGLTELDHVYCADLDVPRTAELTLQVLDRGKTLGSLEVFLPNDDAVQVRIRTSAGDPGVTLVDGAAAAAAEGLAAAPPDQRVDYIKVRFRIDDADAQRLTAPTIAVAQAGVEPTVAVDDGTVWGDTADDRVYVGSVRLVWQQEVSFEVRDGDATLGEFTVTLPFSNKGLFSLRTRSGTPPLEFVSASSGDLDAAAAAAAADMELSRIETKVELDDQQLGRLFEPVVHPDQDGIEPEQARDDGTGGDRQAGDGVFTAVLSLRKMPAVTLTVVDGASTIGALTVPLPPDDRTTLKLVTREGADGIQLASTTVTITGVGGAAGGVQSTTTTPSSGCDRFSMVLWVLIAFFAAVFVYLRIVVRRLWRDEVRPFMRAVQDGLAREHDDND